jgi:hypothetical protein
VLEMRERFTEDVFMPSIKDGGIVSKDKVDEYYWAYA